MSEQPLDRLLKHDAGKGHRGGAPVGAKMFTCIACTKQTEDGGEGDGGAARGGGRGTPSSKEAVKSLTTQVLSSVSNNSSRKLSGSVCELNSPLDGRFNLRGSVTSFHCHQ